MKPLTPRERRLLAVAVLIGLIAGLWLAVIGPLVGGFADRAAERARLRTTLLRNQRLMASLPVWRAAAEAQRGGAARFALSAASEPLAVEALKERLRRLAADEGFTLTSVEELPADAPTGAVRVRADMQLSLAQLCESLRRLQTEGAYVVVDYLSISADRAFASGRLAPIDVRLELTAAYAADGRGPA